MTSTGNSSKHRVLIASDHAGYELKEFLKKNIQEVEWRDEGPYDANRIDYPDYAEKVASKISASQESLGILVCGSGAGMCIAANKFPGIRAIMVESEQTAKLSRAHNNTNVLCLGSRILAPEYAKEIVRTWLTTPFEGGRHDARIQKITLLEKKSHASRSNPSDVSKP